MGIIDKDVTSHGAVNRSPMIWVWQTVMHAKKMTLCGQVVAANCCDVVTDL